MTAPSLLARTPVASGTLTGSMSRPLASSVRMRMWLRNGAWAAASAQMPDRSTGAAASRPSPVPAARVSASAGKPLLHLASSAPNPAHDAGTPAGGAVPTGAQRPTGASKSPDDGSRGRPTRPRNGNGRRGSEAELGWARRYRCRRKSPVQPPPEFFWWPARRRRPGTPSRWAQRLRSQLHDRATAAGCRDAGLSCSTVQDLLAGRTWPDLSRWPRWRTSSTLGCVRGARRCGGRARGRLRSGAPNHEAAVRASAGRCWAAAHRRPGGYASGWGRPRARVEGWRDRRRRTPRRRGGGGAGRLGPGGRGQARGDGRRPPGEPADRRLQRPGSRPADVRGTGRRSSQSRSRAGRDGATGGHCV
jgi:hypothetical protein